MSVKEILLSALRRTKYFYVPEDSIDSDLKSQAELTPCTGLVTDNMEFQSEAELIHMAYCSEVMELTGEPILLVVDLLVMVIKLK